MLYDPIRLNFLHGAGGYAWQLAEYMQGNLCATASLELARPMPPTLNFPLVPYPHELDRSCHIRWASGVAMKGNVPGLIGPRGVVCSLVVARDAQAFGGFDPDFADSLRDGKKVSDLNGVVLNGVRHAAGSVLISLLRHGLVEADLSDPQAPPAYCILEPTCIISDSAAFGLVAINQLNGRTIRLSEESAAFLRGCESPIPFTEPLDENIARFLGAGMLRLVTEGTHS